MDDVNGQPSPGKCPHRGGGHAHPVGLAACAHRPAFRQPGRAASACTLAVVQALTGEVAGADGPARRLMSLLEARPLKWLGERSYGLYLW